MGNKISAIYKSPVAKTVPFDPSNCEDITSKQVQGAVDELCVAIAASGSTSYQFGREGVHNNNTFLVAAETLSNKRGLPYDLTNGKLKKITVSTLNVPAIFTIEIFFHDGNLSGLTSITTVTTAGLASTEDFIVDIAVPAGHQIAVKVKSVGNPKPQETGVFLVFKGIVI